MSARLLFEVALRVLGVWFVVKAIVGLTSVATAIVLLVGPYGRPSGEWTYLVSSGISVAASLALGAALIYWAPRIADRFYPSEGATSETEIRVGPGDVYHTACFVLGAYLLVHGIARAGDMAIRAASGSWPGWGMGEAAMECVVNTAAGLVLIFGSRRIGQLVSSLRYDPDSIPRQQFGIRLLLIITVLVAVILGVIRMISLSGVSHGVGD